MDFTFNTFFLIGIIFFLGLIAHIIGQKTFIPRVTFLIIVGIVLGPHLFSLFPLNFVENWFDPITTIALGMIGFLLGEQFSIKKMEAIAKEILYITFAKVIITFTLVGFTLWLIGVPLNIALILASIATATAPAAIFEVIDEMKIKTPFSKKILAIVAFDDIIALLLFSFVLSFASIENSNTPFDIFYHGVVEITMSLLLGFVVGYPIAKITGRLNGGEPIIVEALGAVFIVTGLAQMFGLSSILATMALGSSVVTFATHHKKPFHAIKNIEWPFMVLFFLLAGASLDFINLTHIGLIGIVYILSRVVGFYLGAGFGAKLSCSDLFTRRYIGLTLIPQAGVAIGMALLASHKIDDPSHIILTVILATTVIFEIIGPIISKYILQKSLY